MRRTTFVLALFSIMAVLGASKAQAVLIKTYTYTGNTFTTAVAPWTLNDSISGSFTIDCGLAGGAGDCTNLPFVNNTAAVTSYSFSAGSLTITDTDDISSSFFLVTDSSMNLMLYSISVQGDFFDFFQLSGIQGQGDNAFVGSLAQTAFTPTPGTWTFTSTMDPGPSPVPEPSTLALFGLGLAGLGLTRRKKA